MPASRARLFLLAGLATFFAGSVVEVHPDGVRGKPVAAVSPIHALGELPLRFEENRGQADDMHARFVARRGARSLALADEGATLRVQDTTLTLTVDGGRTVTPVGGDVMEARTNYLRGRDPKNWLTDIPSFAKVTYPAVKDGVDVVYHGEHGQMEYDFVVAPGTDVASLAMNIGGGDSLSLDDDGSLAIKTARGTLRQPKPRVYQRDDAGHEHDVDARYRIQNNGAVGFLVASYDRARPLVIDPEIGFSTYLGGNSDDGVNGIAVGTDGSVIAVGGTRSIGIANSTSIQPRTGVAMTMPADVNGLTDAFVAKLSPSGSLTYFTYVIGSQVDTAQAITLVNGLPYVGGYTSSPDFPITQGNPTTTTNRNQDGFVFALNAAGSALVFSTYVSPSAQADSVDGIAVANNVVYVGGTTNPDGAYAYAGSFPVPTTSALITLTTNTLGQGYVGTGGVAVDTAGVYVAGSAPYDSFNAVQDAVTGYNQSPVGAGDAFLVRLNPADITSEATYGTFLGGAGSDNATAIALGATGHVYIVGNTSPTEGTVSGASFPTKNAFQPANAGNSDAFVTHIDTTATSPSASLVWSTFLGGSSADFTGAIAVDSLQHVFVTGTTQSNDFPSAPRADTTRTDYDAFIAELDSNGQSLLYSALLGGSENNNALDYGQAIAVNSAGIAFGGQTSSTQFPTKNAYQPTYGGGSVDGWIAYINTSTPLSLTPTSVTLQAGASQVFTAAGGVGSLTFSLASSTSGGNINAATGQYTAGPNAGSDIVRVTDLAGNVANSSVTVTPAAVQVSQLVISPSATQTYPHGTANFTASGGTAPYAFELQSNGSGGTIGADGQYIAGARGDVTDQVRVSDASGQSAIASVQVTGSITISPTDGVVGAGGTLQLTAHGGSGGPYQWSATDGTIQGGSFIAPGSSEVVTVTARDSLGNSASVQVAVGDALSVAPADPSTFPKGTLAFSAAGGHGSGYTFTLIANGSGGTVDPASGAYTAGATGSSQDVLQVSDTDGNRTSTSIQVGAALSIRPTSANVDANAQLALSAAGGSGAGYTYAIETSASGASVTTAGVYTSGAKGGVDVVRVTDSAGNTARATITAAAAPATTTAAPPATTSPPSTSVPDVDAGDGSNLNIGVGSADTSNSSCSVGPVGGRASNGSLALVGLAFALLAGRRRRHD